MRFIVGGIMHETHTFSAEPTPIEAFDIARGEECWSFAGSNHSLGGVIDQCRASEIELVPTFFAHATPSAPPDHETFQTLLNDLVNRIADAAPADGLILTLHGAMVAEGHPDAESEILRQVRLQLGEAIPIAVTLDLHANIGQSMVDLATVITTYDTYPHIDANERAREAVLLLQRTVNGEIDPRMALVKPPLLPVPQAMYTAQDPMKRLFDHAHRLERNGEALSISIAGGFPYADVPEAGMSFLATADGSTSRAAAMASALAEQAWEHRAQFHVKNMLPDEAVRQAIDWPEGPVVLVDVGDNIGGGTTGDGTVLLYELLRQNAREATVFIADPDAVEHAFRAGIGEAFRAEVGGKIDNRHGLPVDVAGFVRLLSDGAFVYDGPENAGLPARMGRTAVIRVGEINLVLTSIKMPPGDLQQIKSVGIDPERQQIIVAKAAVRWRGGYAPIVKHSIDVDTPGLGSIDLNRFEFRDLRRPIYPLDPDTDWQHDS
jgi:microcystin degradation protein MlrC